MDEVVRRLMRLGSKDAPIRAEDLPDFDAAIGRVLALLSDQAWHSATEVIAASRQREGLRRMRELKPLGWDYEKVRRDHREWWYRLKGRVKPEKPRVPQQAVLFR